MVAYNEGDPRIPGNAELEPQEVAAFESGDITMVTDAGKDYGMTCTNYAAGNNFEGPNIIIGARALVEQPELSFVSFRMRISFMEGVRAGASTRIAEIRAGIGLSALSEFGKRPDVQAEATRQTRQAFDRLVSMVQAINTRTE